MTKNVSTFHGQPYHAKLCALWALLCSDAQQQTQFNQLHCKTLAKISVLSRNLDTPQFVTHRL